MLELLHLRWTGWNDLLSTTYLQRIAAGAVDRAEEVQGCFNSTARGYTMPAFTFEKISPPVRRGPLPPIVKKQRGVIVQILDRFVEARVKRSLREEKDVIARRKQKPAK
jgi:hypothetical protein